MRSGKGFRGRPCARNEWKMGSRSSSGGSAWCTNCRLGVWGDIRGCKQELALYEERQGLQGRGLEASQLERRQCVVHQLQVKCGVGGGLEWKLLMELEGALGQGAL